MKTSFFARKSWMGVIGMCLIMGMQSCSNEEPVQLTDPAELYAEGLSFADDALSLKINGYEVDDCQVTFEPVEGDSTLLLMTIDKIVPLHAVQALVQITPEDGQIALKGTNEGLPLTGHYVEVSGLYQSSDAEGGKSLKIECTHSFSHDVIVEQPYEYNFNEDCLSVSAGPGGGTVQWQGETWDSWDFVQSVLDKIRLRIAQEFSGMKLEFHADGTFTTWLKRAGQSDYEEWMKAYYWVDYQNMYWILTPEQYEKFSEQWFGSSEGPASPFRKVNTPNGDFYELELMFWGGDAFTWTISNPSRYDALDRFMQGKGMAGLTEEEQQEMKLFREVLYDVDDLTDWMSWSIVLFSETVE